MKSHVEKQTRRYVIIIQKDGDGVWRRKKVMNKSDKVVWKEEINDE